MKTYYGDAPRWFIGEVIDNTPPEGLEGRVRVRIFGVHSPSTRDIPQKDLPWAQVMVPSTEGGVSGIGMNSKIESGATCFGIFMDGAASQIPLVLGTIPKIERPSGVQTSVELGILGGLDDVPIRISPIPKTDDVSGDFLFEVPSDVSTYDNVQDELFYRDSLRYSGIDPRTSGIRDDVLNESDMTDEIRRSRESISIKFFLANGYTIKQSISITTGIKHSSNFNTYRTDPRNNGIGLCSWTGKRLSDLKKFSNQWQKFSVQLSFILYELNTTKQKTNTKILKNDNLRLKRCETTVPRIFAIDYLDIKDNDRIDLIRLETMRIHEEYVG